MRVIVSGGGTGGHIFPAVSIADKLRELNPGSEILFVGAEGKMEMEKVPAAGYRIVGLPIVGLQRQLNLKNIINDLKLPFKLIGSLRKAGKIIKEFKPDVVVGVGGYASAPLLYMAQRLHYPTLIQEQHGFAGLANKLLAKKADSICVAYEDMDRFFPKDKIVLSGNPIRPVMNSSLGSRREEACGFYSMDSSKKHILVIGGSLGSRTLNNAMKAWIEAGCPGGEGVEVLWQCGKYYKAEMDDFMKAHPCPGVRHTDFIARMDLAYALADVVISRSGASSVSEICAIGKAAVFVPSPNVAEDHQTHNAMALVRKGAALLVKDSEASEKMLPSALALCADDRKREQIEQGALSLAKTQASLTIADEVYRIAEKRK